MTSITYLLAEVNVIHQSRERIILKVNIENYEISNDEEYSYFRYSDWLSGNPAGAPDIPSKSIQIALPPEGVVSYDIRPIRQTIKRLDKPIVPIPHIIQQDEDSTSDYYFRLDEQLYSVREDNLVAQREPERFRFYNIVPLDIKPVFYDHQNRELTIHEEFEIEITIRGDISYQNMISSVYDNIYRSFLINYETGKYWQTPLPKVEPVMPFQSSDFWYSFTIEDQPGVYQIDYEDLSSLPEFCDPATIRIFTTYREIVDEPTLSYEYKLREVPIEIVGADNYRLEQDSKIFFAHESREETRLPQYSTQRHYWLTFGTTDLHEPIRTDNLSEQIAVGDVTNFRKKELASTTLREDADIMIIYPDEFENQTQQFVNYYDRNYDYHAIIAKQQDIFDEYSGGNPEPIALRHAIQNVLNDNPNLQHVALMGSGTKNWAHTTEKNKIIVYLDTGGRAVDDLFVMFSGSNIPQLSIGRMPAQNVEQLDFLFNRIKKYVENPTPGYWRNKLLFLADDEHKNGGIEGGSSIDQRSNHTVGLEAAKPGEPRNGQPGGLNHTGLAEWTANALNKGVYIDKVYGIEYSFDAFNNKPEAAADNIERLNEGRLIWYFIGHGHYDFLGDEDYFRGATDIPLLDNLEHLPLFIAASCNVGEFDSVNYDSLAEKLLFAPNGGSVVSVAASRGCSGSQNTKMLKLFLERVINHRETTGSALLYAKVNSSAGMTNSRLFHLFGDPVMDILPPLPTGNITGLPDSLRARQTGQINGDFELPLSGKSIVRAYDADHQLEYSNILGGQIYEIEYWKHGDPYYYGSVDMSNGEYGAGFIVPDDVTRGDGRVITFFEDNDKQYVNYIHPVKLSNIPLDITNPTPPQVELWLDSETFQDGDYVSSEPVIYADIEAENGINILGSAGHSILAILNNQQPVDVTSGFIYDPNSYTTGRLSWQLDRLEEGRHTLQLLVFDNFNNYTIAQTSFITRDTAKISIEDMLPYPNPISQDGHFTFIITEAADVTITIYTITGRKIRTIQAPALSSGFNKVYWDGRDQDGDRLANNTYFYKISAKENTGNSRTERIGKVVILK
jgi:hypothetical protein